MRNFKERKAEIFRRSQQRIQKRTRARRIIISLCIPLALCLGVFARWLIPELKNVPKRLEELTQESGEFAPETYASMEDVTFDRDAYAVVSVDDEKYVLEQPACHDLVILISNIRSGDILDMLLPESSESEDAFISNFSSSDASAKKIILTISEADGIAAVYSLSYMCLTDMTTGEAFALTEIEYQALIRLLELL